MRTVNQRRYLRIPCRNVQGCIETKQGASVIVRLLNISRGGVAFTSSAEFYTGTPVSIATHYIEGGQNIFTDGRIIRVQRQATLIGPVNMLSNFALINRAGVWMKAKKPTFKPLSNQN